MTKKVCKSTQGSGYHDSDWARTFPEGSQTNGLDPNSNQRMDAYEDAEVVNAEDLKDYIVFDDFDGIEEPEWTGLHSPIPTPSQEEPVNWINLLSLIICSSQFQEAIS